MIDSELMNSIECKELNIKDNTTESSRERIIEIQFENY